MLLTLGAFVLRVHGLGRQSFWLDEVDAIAMAGAPLAAQLRKLTAIGENGPLYFLLFRGWLSLAGTSEFGARALSALASTLAVPLLGALGLRLFRHRPTALLAAALGAVSPYYVWYAQDAKMYPTFAALALGAQYAFLRAWEAPSDGDTPDGGDGRARAARAAWWAAYVLCSSFALYVHLFAALQIAANTVAGLWLWPRRPGGRAGFCVATGLLVLPYLPLAVWQAPVLLEGRDVGYRPTPPPAIAVALLEQLTWHLNPPPNRRLLLLLGGAMSWGLYRSGRRAPLLAIWLLVPVALTVFLQGTVPVFRDRYLIPLLVPLLLLLARAMAPPWAQRTASGGPADAAAGNLLGPAVAVFVVAGFGYGLLNRPPNPDFRAAAALVHAQAGPGEAVGFLAGYAERPFDYYYGQRPGRYEKVQLPYTNAPGLSESDGLRAVATSLRDGRWLWVVRFEDWLWDERDLTGRYLAARGAREVLRRDFGGVSVSRYELSRPATG